MEKEKLKRYGDSNYFISSHGRIIRLNKHGVKQLKLHPNKNRGGYLTTTFSIDGVKSQMYIHQLVWLKFGSDKKKEGFEVDHIDRNRLNNNIDNLQYISKSENLKRRDYGKDRK